MENRKFVIIGKPRGKDRPRFSNRGGFVRAYSTKATIEYEKLVQESFLKQCKDKTRKDYNGEVIVRIRAFFKPPKSTSKKKYKELVEIKQGYLHKPDIDNIAKIILDSLNGVAYKDDNQISCLYVTKEYSEEDKVEVEIHYAEKEESYGRIRAQLK